MSLFRFVSLVFPLPSFLLCLRLSRLFLLLLLLLLLLLMPTSEVGPTASVRQCLRRRLSTFCPYGPFLNVYSSSFSSSFSSVSILLSLLLPSPSFSSSFSSSFASPSSSSSSSSLSLFSFSSSSSSYSVLLFDMPPSSLGRKNCRLFHSFNSKSIATSGRSVRSYWVGELRLVRCAKIEIDSKARRQKLGKVE